MISKIKKHLNYFLNNNKDYPFIYAISVSFYPIFFYYSNNYTLVNTWSHVANFLLQFALLPVILFGLITLWSKPSEYRKKILTFFTIFIFVFLLHICVLGKIQILVSIALSIISFLVAFFLFKHLKKIVVFQLLLAFMGFFTFSHTFISSHSISKEWMQQPDNIAEVLFKKKPNVYYIQPDGYTNFSELKRGYYNLKSNKLESFLESKGFKNYSNFRSNYATTLSSNSSSLMMKHHYYNAINYSEVLNDRNIIISDNTVLNVFKNNGYKNYFIAQRDYLLLNKPKMGFDYCNINYSDISFITRGIDDAYEILEPLKKGINDEINTPKFFFIRINTPSHTKGKLGVEEENKAWFNRLETSNVILTKTIKLIKESDPNALVIIMADHGGYVGLEHTLESLEKTNDRDKIYSIFSSSLSIHWPEQKAPYFDTYLKSSVNLYRIIFSYLSEDESYLLHLQSDYSFAVFNINSSSGVYKCIDDKGAITFDKVSN